jgi:hypothetical protein
MVRASAHGLSDGEDQMRSAAVIIIIIIIIYLFICLFILTANGFVPGGSGTTIRHNTQNNTHHTK